MDVVIVYSTGCPRCNVLKTKLASKGIAYEEITDVEKMMALGIDEVPVMSANGELYGFSKAVEWINSQGEN